MPLFRVHAYDHENYATLIIESDCRARAGTIATEFVAAMHLGYYPADHSQRWPEIPDRAGAVMVRRGRGVRAGRRERRGDRS
jgi:hypothetical protein